MMNNHSTHGLDEIISPRSPLGILDRIVLTFKLLRHIWNITSAEREVQKIHRFAVQRDSTFDDAVIRIINTGFSLLPTNADKLDFAGEKNTVVHAYPVEPVKFRIETSDGFHFVDWEGSKKQYSTYWLFRDKIPKHLTPLTFCTSSAVHRSFNHGVSRVPGDKYIPGAGGTIVEAGAYVGYKAVAFGRRVGLTGQVLAIEVNRENFGLLCENIRLNGMEGQVRAKCCAVWSSDTDLPLFGQSRMNNSVAKVDEKSPTQRGTVSAKSLDTLIDEAELTKIDFLNLQLNGAEVDALEGLVKNWSKVKYVNIITRFHQDGVLIVDRAREFIEQRGGRVLVDERCGHLYNLTAQLN